MKALGGAWAHEGAPEGNLKRLACPSSMTTRGIIVAMAVEIAADRQIFSTSLDEFLSPNCSPATKSKSRHMAADLPPRSLNASTACF
jgi:hypothetical protein